MRAKFELQSSLLHREIRALHRVVGGAFRDVMFSEGGLAAQDAQKLTPPFGKEPIQESMTAQLAIGKKAVEKDFNAGFQPIKDLEIWKEKGEMRKTLRRLVAANQLEKASEILRRSKIRNRDVIPWVKKDHHEHLRNSYGRVRLNGVGPFIVVDKSSIKPVLRQAQELVGTAKRGWNPAIRFFGREVNNVLLRGSMRGNLMGYGKAGGTEEQPWVEFSNLVPYAQKMRGHIESRMIQNRIRNIPIRRRAIEAHFRRKLAEKGIKA